MKRLSLNVAIPGRISPNKEAVKNRLVEFKIETVKDFATTILLSFSLMTNELSFFRFRMIARTICGNRDPAPAITKIRTMILEVDICCLLIPGCWCLINYGRYYSKMKNQ